MTDRQRRIAKLVEDIRAALDRGVSPDQIHSELVRRNLTPEKATVLLQRILTTADRPAPPAHAVSAARSSAEPARAPTRASRTPSTAPTRQPHSPSDADARTTPTRPPRPARSQRTPFFLATALFLLVTGFGGRIMSVREAEARTSAVAVTAARIDADIADARSHLAYIDEQLEERRVDADQIEWLRARVARGPDSFDTFAEYEEMYRIYERRRERWNRSLPQYRVVSDAYRTLAGIHNSKLDTLKALRGSMAGAGEPTIRYARIAAVVAPM